MVLAKLEAATCGIEHERHIPGLDERFHGAVGTTGNADLGQIEKRTYWDECRVLVAKRFYGAASQTAQLKFD